MGYRWRRFKARLRFSYDIKDIISWDSESCNRCGINYRLFYLVSDEKWIEVNGRDGGLLCFDCFIRTAEEKGVEIVLEDIKHIGVHVGEKFFDIIEEIQ